MVPALNVGVPQAAPFYGRSAPNSPPCSPGHCVGSLSRTVLVPQCRQPCPRIRIKALLVQSSCSRSPGAGRGSCVWRLLTAGFVVRGGLPQFCRVVLRWNLIPGIGCGAFLEIRAGRPSTFWCPACAVGSLGGVFLQSGAMPCSEGVQHSDSVCMRCAALITASLLQGSSGLCPPRAAPAEDAECPGEHAAGARHAHHHQVGPCLLQDFFCVPHRRAVL